MTRLWGVGSLYLKYLAVEGFKSFPEINGLEMSPGVCVLVGPNGSGKSNLTDAFNWVLGEDDLSALRSRSDEELVFCGNDELLALDSAIVTAVFDERPARNRDGSLPATTCLCGAKSTHGHDIPEGRLIIAREQHREGEERFFLNNEPSTREEVREALTRLGVAFPPVAVIRQGELERLLNLHPKELRAEIERAIGIPDRLAELHRLQGEIGRLETRLERVREETDEAHNREVDLRKETERDRRRRNIEGRLRERRAALLHRVLHSSTDLDSESSAELLQLLGLPSDPPSAATEAEDRQTPPPDTGGTDILAFEAEIQDLDQELRNLGETNPRASDEWDAACIRLQSLQEESKRLTEELEAARAARQSLIKSIDEQFETGRKRISERFAEFYALLSDGGEARLVQVESGKEFGAERSGVTPYVRPPGKLIDEVSSLSGGERSLAALSLALALFQELEAPFFILDEVEPALDDTNIRRVQKVLDQVGAEHQVIMVSHQQRAKETGDVVFGVERNLDGASQVKFRYEPHTRRLEVFRRTRAADHLRRYPGDGRAVAARSAAPQVARSSMGGSGSPTQAALGMNERFSEQDDECGCETGDDSNGGTGSGPAEAGAGGGGISRPHVQIKRRVQHDGSWKGIWEDVMRPDDEDESPPQEIKRCC